MNRSKKFILAAMLVACTTYSLGSIETRLNGYSIKTLGFIATGTVTVSTLMYFFLSSYSQNNQKTAPATDKTEIKSTTTGNCPLDGNQVGWLTRTRELMKAHPGKTAGLIAATAVGIGVAGYRLYPTILTSPSHGSDKVKRPYGAKILNFFRPPANSVCPANSTGQTGNTPVEHGVPFTGFVDSSGETLFSELKPVILNGSSTCEGMEPVEYGIPMDIFANTQARANFRTPKPLVFNGTSPGDMG